jgi:HlyD family secretion protein
MNRPHARWVLALILAAACCGESTPDIEASGTLEATEAELGFQVAGRIDSVLVQEGDRVTAGQRIAVLDLRELVARRDAATAMADAQRARLAELQRGFRPEEVAQAEVSLQSAEQRLSDATRDLTRTRNLYEGGAVSRQALDNQQSAYNLALAERDRLQQQVNLLRSGSRPEQITAQRALLAQAEATQVQTEATLTQAVVVAPFTGSVTRRQREPGEVISAGLPVVSLANLNDRWVRIYVREDEVGRVKLGEKAAISVDAFPERKYAGEVVFISQEAEFTPRNVQTREERVKLVYRVKVRVVGDTAQDLKPGLPADVRLTGR